MFNVLLACLDNWNTSAEIPYILKTGGCNVTVYCSSKSWLLANSYYDNWIESNADKKIYAKELIELAKTGNYQWIILGDDPLIKYMNEEIDDDETFRKVMPISKIEQRNALSSKKGFSDFCLANNIDTPGYATYNNENDLENVKANLHFPVINKIDFSWGGIDMFVSHSYEEFIANLHKIPLNENVLIQEFIEGTEIPVEALFYKGELLTYNTSKILQFDKGPFTYSTRRLYYEDKKIMPLLVQLGKKLGLNSFVNITYLYDGKKEKYYIIEADARPNSWMAYGRFTGHDFSAGVKRIVSGDYVTGYKDTPMVKPFVEIALFHKDIRRALWQNKLTSVLQWLVGYKGYWRYLTFYDKKLNKKIFAEFRDILGHKIKKLTGSKK